MSRFSQVKSLCLFATMCGAANLQATTWTNMLGGAWNDAANWDLGVPDGTSANLDRTTASYRVSVDETPSGVISNLYISNAGANTTRLDVAASGFTVSNGYIQIGRGAQVCVTNNGAWGYAGYTPAADRIALINNGGLLSIDGGTVAFTNLRNTPSKASRMFVGDWATGRVDVTAGTFAMNGWFTPDETNTAAQFYLGNGAGSYGNLKVSGTGIADFRGGWGTTLYIGNSSNSYGHFEVSGTGIAKFGDGGGRSASLFIGNGIGGYGHLDVSGAGRVELGNIVSSVLYIGYLGTGIVDLRDQAELVFISSNRTVYLAYPGAATGRVTVAGNAKFRMPTNKDAYAFRTGEDPGSLAEITVSDDGVMDLYGGLHFYLGSLNTQGRSVLTIKDRGYFEAGGGLSMCMVAGGTTGYSEINLEGGTLSITNSSVNSGLYVGRVNNWGTGFSKACVNMSGGFLNLMKPYYGHNYGARDGILVGLVALNGIGGAQGDFNLSGGTVTNFGALTLGLGQGATGTVRQTGGLFVQGQTTKSTLRNAVIGWGGGCGSYLVSIGTTLVYDDVFVGGVTTNQVPNILASAFTMAKASKGLLRVDNGRFTVTNDMTLFCGSKGEGTIIIGSNGVCEAKNIVLTNNTQSVVRFVLGKQGSGVLRATDTLKVCEGTQLEVDARAYTGDEAWVKLIAHGSRVGDFASEDITVVGHGQVIQNPGAMAPGPGVWLHRARGTLLSVF